MPKKILITGGAVHAHVDAVKIITNKFKGGLIADLAVKLADLGFNITYLTSKQSTLPESRNNIEIVFHEGFFDYQEKVLALAPKMDAAILGAAVANLIPANPWKGKFPSHNYNEGDIVNVEFLVTPRVITKVKAVAPNLTLIGFKLLSGAPHDELMDAAWHTLLDSRATAVIANDALNLQEKFVITKEAGVHQLSGNDALAGFLAKVINATHYKTEIVPQSIDLDFFDLAKAVADIEAQGPGFFVQKGPYKFGTVAIRRHKGFVTTGRGKSELSDYVYVSNVDHGSKTVFCVGKKASLNAPLLEWIFHTNPNVHKIVHGHCFDKTLPILEYFLPGTVEDSVRFVTRSFNIKGHGCFYLYDEFGTLIN